jgi:hypothetical protein
MAYKTKTTKKKKTKTPKPLTYFSNQQFISFKLVKGKHTIDLGTALNSGKEVAIYLEMQNEDTNATWSIDAIADCDNYCQTRTIPNNVTTSWHHINTNTDTTTTLKLNINTTSDHKEARGLAKIRIY